MRPRLPNYFILFLSLLVFGCASQQINYAPVKADITVVKPHCYPEVAKEFLRWNKSNGKELKGLTKRRQEEMNLFLTDCNNP
jgi:hypothetical protein